MKTRIRLFTGILMSVFVTSSVVTARDLSIRAEPHLESGLFTDPVLPREGDSVRITVRAGCTGRNFRKDLEARLAIFVPRGGVVAEKALILKRDGDWAEASWSWICGPSGVYTIQARLDHRRTILETNEKNNEVQLTLPVLGRGRNFHFVYDELDPSRRWATHITMTRDDQRLTLKERGVLPLEAVPGGLSWDDHDQEKVKENSGSVLEQIEEHFYAQYGGEGKSSTDFGKSLTKNGGESFALDRSVAAMKAAQRVKRERPTQFVAVWNKGPAAQELVEYYRQTADLVLLEAPLSQLEGRGVEALWKDIEPTLESATDLNFSSLRRRIASTTLVALDASLARSESDLKVLEELVRRVRRESPDMNGLAWFNSSLQAGSSEREMHRRVTARIEDLHYKYFIGPCLTLPIYQGREEREESLWVGQASDGHWIVSVSLKNIGGVTAEAAEVEISVDGKVVGSAKAPVVPARSNAMIYGEVVLRKRLKLESGERIIEARILNAGSSAILDGSVAYLREIP